MAKGKSTWKYNKLLTGRRNYFDGLTQPSMMQRSEPTWYTPPTTTTTQSPTNNMGIVLGGYTSNPTVIQPKTSTVSNIIAQNGGVPAPKTTTPPQPGLFGQAMGMLGSAITNPGAALGMAGLGPAALAQGISSAIGGIGQLGGNLIANGLESGAGSAISSVGNALGAIPILGGLAQGALGIVGGGVNALFGSKINKENVGKVQSSIGELNNFASNASSFDQLAQDWGSSPAGMSFSNSFIGKDGLFSNKAKKKANALREQMEVGKAFVQRSLVNNAENIGMEQMNSLESNYAAFGGELNTQGGDFTNGLLYIDNGGSHESNPYEGVPLGVDPEGTPNLVEEGETVFKDYVFSRRMKVPGAVRKKYKLGGTKSISFAEASKRLSKESEERPNDPISARGLEAIMRDLAQAQEESRVASNGGTQYAHGGQMGNLYDDGSFLPSINTYKWVKGYNGGWYESGTTNYKDSYLRNVAAMQDADIDRALNNQYTYYMDPANKDTQRWKAIDEFYSKNPEFRIPDVTGRLNSTHYSTIRSHARDGQPGYAHMLFDNATPADRSIRYFRRNADGTATPMLGEDQEGGLPLPWENTNDAGYTFLKDPRYSNYREAARIERPYDADSNTIYTDVYYDYNEPAPEIGDEPSEDAPSLTMEDMGGKSWEGWRYAPMLGQGIFALTDALGWTNKPDYSNADAILEASRSAGEVQPVGFKPIGNYLTYRPFDRDYYINKMNAEAGASRRAIANTSGGNRAAAMAGILAADNNYMNQIGGLARQAEEYNLAQRQQVEEFNRGTNTTNSQGFLQADIANQEARAKAQDFTLRGSMAAAELREKSRLAADAAKQANLTGLFQSIGGIGEENKNMNMLKFLIASGAITAQPDLLNLVGIKVKNKDKESTTKANGGKIKRKRGLTI